MSPRRLRLALVLAGIALGGIVLLTWTQQWLLVELDEGKLLTVGGQAAAPALSALGLAALALSAALAISGRVLRVVLGVVEAGIGILVVSTAVSVIVNPVVASASTVTDATAVSGSESIAALVAAVSLTPWPWVAGAAGALLTLAGAAVVVTSRRWPVAGRRYEPAGAADAGSTVSDWDALSDGSDPTHR